MTIALAQPLTIATAPTAAAVRAVSLGRVIDGRAILRDLNFSIRPGDFIALLGANGAGKTTLLRMMATLVPPTNGDLLVFEHSIRSHSLSIRRRLGLIGHSPMLYRDLSAKDNLVFFGKLYGVRDPIGRAEELLDWIGLWARAADPVKTFSRGMTQRVAIARALMHEPDLLLADEPFAGLDAPSAGMLEDMLARLHQEGKTIIVATHDLDQSRSIAQRMMVLRRGELVVDAFSGVLDQASLLKEVAS